MLIADETSNEEREDFRRKVKRKGFEVFDLMNEVHRFSELLAALCSETARVKKVTGKIPDRIARTGIRLHAILCE